MIIRLLQENPFLSANALAEKIGITKAEGILLRDGADNGGSWVILSNNQKDV